MKRTQRATSALLLCILLFSLITGCSSSQDQIKEGILNTRLPNIEIVSIQKPFSHPLLDELGSMSYQYALVINGVENHLFPTFDDPEQAKKAYETRLSQSEGDEKQALHDAYEDLCEGEERNREILHMIETNFSGVDADSFSEKMKALSYRMPYDTPIGESYVSVLYPD